MNRATNQAPLTIAMVGTRGVPAAYGGFETAVEEIGRRLVERGHTVVVYTRGAQDRSREYLGMRTVHLPALPVKQAETLSHTGLSVAHMYTHKRPDVAFVFNAANSPFLPLIRLRNIPVALHMDGLEWRRSKWGNRGKAYYRWAEEFGVRKADACIADAPGIASYYRDEFDIDTELLRYGAPILHEASAVALQQYGVEEKKYHLVVARFEPENHVLEIVRGYRDSAAKYPLIVVGSAPYAADYTQRIHETATGDPRIQLVGGVYDQPALDGLYFHALTYVHGHSVGGTNPSLLRAMGAATATIGFDVNFNRETLADHGYFFTTANEVKTHIETAESDETLTKQIGEQSREHAATAFRWEDVTAAYESLAYRLNAGESIHPSARHSRRKRAGE